MFFELGTLYVRYLDPYRNIDQKAVKPGRKASRVWVLHHD